MSNFGPAILFACAAAAASSAHAVEATPLPPSERPGVLVPAAPNTAISDGSSIFDRFGVPVARVPGRVLLRLNGIEGARLAHSKSDDREASTVLARIGARTGVVLTFVRPLAIGWALAEIRDARTPDQMPNEDETLALIGKLDGDAAVAATTDERWFRARATPNDPGFSQMWHFASIGAEDAWDITQGLGSQRVGVVDTGLVRTHEDVGARAVAGFDFVTDNGNDGDRRDANFNDPGDACQQEGTGDSFHGTHVAGTIGARANNAVGVPGLNFNAGLVIARALGVCGGSLTDIMEGALWLAGASVPGVADIGADKVSVMNLSLGVDNVACSRFEQESIDFIDAQGVLFVAAAGNNGGAVGSPGNCSRVVSVAAHGPTNKLASYSSFGTQITLVAPGGDFSLGQAAGVLSSIGPSTSGYAFLQGTSMAAPHVTGSISLMQALDPTLTRTQIVTILTSTGGVCEGCQGKPRLLLDRALEAVTPGSEPNPGNPGNGLADDAFEENDTLDTAITASCGTDASLVARARDVDFFRLTARKASDIEVRVTATNGQDIDLALVSGSAVLASSETSGGDEVLRGRTGGQALGIRVTPFVDRNGAASQDTYRLTIRCRTATGDVTDAFEQNDALDLSDVAVLPATGENGLTPPTPDGSSKSQGLVERPGFENVSGCRSTTFDTTLVAAIALLALLALRPRKRRAEAVVLIRRRR
jgi:serine protease